MATGCKPVAPWSYGGSNPPPSTSFRVDCCREAVVAQLVERVLGKDEVTGSIPVPGSRNKQCLRGFSGKAEVGCGSGLKGFATPGGGNSTVESHSSKVMVAGSNPVPRSRL